MSTHTQTRALAHSRTRAHAHTHARTHSHGRTHAHTHTLTRTPIHAHPHNHTDTSTPPHKSTFTYNCTIHTLPSALHSHKESSTRRRQVIPCSISCRQPPLLSPPLVPFLTVPFSDAYGFAVSKTRSPPVSIQGVHRASSKTIRVWLRIDDGNGRLNRFGADDGATGGGYGVQTLPDRL